MTGVSRPNPAESACAACLRRTWLIAALAGRITYARERCGRLGDVLSLSDDELIAALGSDRGSQVRARYEAFAAEADRNRIAAAGLAAYCLHDSLYPPRLRQLADAPAVLHVLGERESWSTLVAAPAIAIVGARRASAYGIEAARTIARGLASAGVVVVSGMALGIDSAAHEGALDARGPTIAVLAGAAEAAYPAGKRGLHRRLAATGAVVSEMPPGFVAHRWCFPARNRTIAGLAGLTLVVEATERSGSLITARIARERGRDVAALPGRVTSELATGTNALLYDGAFVVRSAQDALDLLFGAGMRIATPAPDRGELEPPLRRLLGAIDDGRDSVAALTASAASVEGLLSALGELELLGYLRRVAGGRYVRVA